MEFIDERPIVYVTSPSFFFNITKSAVFKDVIFDGINAFAYIQETDTEWVPGFPFEGEPTGSEAEDEDAEAPTLGLEYYPIEKCKL